MIILNSKLIESINRDLQKSLEFRTQGQSILAEVKSPAKELNKWMENNQKAKETFIEANKLLTKINQLILENKYDLNKLDKLTLFQAFGLTDVITLDNKKYVISLVRTKEMEQLGMTFKGSPADLAKGGKFTSSNGFFVNLALKHQVEIAEILMNKYPFLKSIIHFSTTKVSEQIALYPKNKYKKEIDTLGFVTASNDIRTNDIALRSIEEIKDAFQETVVKKSKKSIFSKQEKIIEEKIIPNTISQYFDGDTYDGPYGVRNWRNREHGMLIISEWDQP